MKFTRLNNTILNKGFFRFIAPGSKSVTNRALIMLGLNENKAALENILIAEDTLVMINALYDLGAELIFDCKVNILTKTGICQPRNRNVYLGYAGTAYRFLLPYLLTMRGKFKMYGEEELHKRPITELISCMKNLVDGMVYEDTGNRSIYCEINKLKNISSVSVDPVKSSQFLTALLLVIPVIYDKFTIECTNKPVSSTYIDLTMDMLKKTGINIEQENYSAYKIFGKQKYNFLKYNIEGDYSAASYFFALSAISGIRSEILNLDCLSKQGDKKFIEILERMGCVVNYKNSCNSIEILPPEKLRSAGEIDMSKMQDVVPTAAVAAVFAEGETKIVNIEN
ncbi:hypothetical protein KA977_02845, partial [Candidatus Dependentiae bacterium]|nr:hypothetical protein [Candidatus Dependentiae bacterium]